MKHALPAAAALLAAALLPAPPARAAGERGGIYSAVTLVSDYRYQGVSNSDQHAAIQANVHYFRPDGWYAGVFATTVDFNDYGTSYELDIYGGRTLTLDKQTDLKLQVLYTTFPDNRTPGPTYDFIQGGVSLVRKAGPLTLIGQTTVVPEASYGSGKAYRAELGADYVLTPHLTLKALAGRRWIGRGSDRTYWSLGAATMWKHLTFEVRYQDSNLSRARCGYNPDICGPALTAAVTAAFPLILF
ncbi:TorF family putative porin [Phenylobacterium sp.]|uniref:TorF family putative porin n=1 Tax=Phenylobacterium sp. TaxID=1871053 RepID=UPI0025FD4F71|nr:TorF family putative porin [Phenylobacterium sp.]